MNWLEKPFRKKSDYKNWKKTVKIKVKLPHVNKKPLARKRIFVQTPFSHSTLNLERKMFTRKPLAFSLHFLFRHDQNHYSNLTSKIMKMCEQILKKNIAVRIAETTRSENPIKRHPTIKNVSSLIYDYLQTKSWNKKVKTIKSNLLKYDKKSDQILLQIEILKKLSLPKWIHQNN